MVNSQSFETAALEQLPVLYRVARRMTKNADTAEDLVGQTLLRAATGWATFDGRHTRSWLIRIMSNIYSKEMGKLSAQARHEPLEEGSALSGDVWHDLDCRLLSSSILDELENLPQEYRLAVTLCDMEELSYDEAAEAMSVPVGTVRSRLFRGRQMLRTRLADLTAYTEGVGNAQ